MKLSILILVVSLSLVLGRPQTVLDFEGDDHEHTQEGEAGRDVGGEYSWTSPEGENFKVVYVADEDGYRVVESNAVPVNADGIAADGNQGSFTSEEGGEEEGEEEEEEEEER
ncbi:uncharacterized protein LOC122253763 [Penaeus japonicus]|uniref:uncharacterized protein LOC122253763 n=1 Tax=Penaeus japonicus TaxID=27405 RepID=UPI001C7119C3|nr:uncharacterized protein LOC122253763 [Penaeus japonicus]